ncbi:hypothetical protein DL96DRAFT_1500984 [Flagelloscypha sp. PMI_526]|nr:hypothetical protein DL96DRAFT_1500984 [Flagelloscypha sp. PMI_526]
MVALDTLNQDVLFSILLLVHDSSRHTIFSILLVNSVLSKAAQPFVFRHCTLDFTQFTSWQLDAQNSRKPSSPEPFALTQRRIQALLDHQDNSLVFRAIRNLVIFSSYSRWDPKESDDQPNENAVRRYSFDENSTPEDQDPQIAKKWGALAQLISRLKHPKNVTFECNEPVPIVLLQALEKHQSTVSLHVLNWTRRHVSTKVGDPNEEALGHSPCLRTLSAKIITGGPHMDYSEPAFQRIVALAPNLDTVHYSTRSAGGCVVYGFSMEEMNEQSRESARFQVEHPMKKSLKTLHWSWMSPNSIKTWETFLDLAQLTTLIVNSADCRTLQYATEQGSFSGVTELKFGYSRRWRDDGGPDEDTVLAQFIASFLTLESLSVTSYGGPTIIEPICTYLAHSLRTLSLHNVEGSEHSREVLSIKDLAKLQGGIPNLQSLEFDINRTLDGRRERGIYAVILTFSHLKNLTIHYDLGIQHHDSSDGYFDGADEDSARDIWFAAGPPGLQSLTLYFGEPNRDIGFGYPASWVLHEQSLRQKIIVRPHERDDLRDQLVVEIQGARKSEMNTKPLNLDQLLAASLGPLPDEDDDL